MNLAIKHALLKRDVAHLTFPDQIQVLPAGDLKAGGPDQRMPDLSIRPSEKSLKSAIELLKTSKRPVIIVGHGVRFNMNDVMVLAETLNCPVLTTFKAKGQISDFHPLGGGVLGRSGTPVASYFMNESDLLLDIGASFSNHTGITPKKPTIQIDFDPLAIAKFQKIDVGLYGEIGATFKEILTQKSRFNRSKINQTAEIAVRWKIWRAEKNVRLAETSKKGLSSIRVFSTLMNLAPEDAIMCVDVGNNAYSFGRYFETKRQTFLMSGYLGSIGFALPAALGAWAAVGESRPIIAVAGDVGFCQYMAELTTAVKYAIPIKVIVLNNNELGKISKEQRSGGWDKWATDLVNPDFADYAKGCGALGIKVTQAADLEASLGQILSHPGPALLEIRTDVGLI